MGQPVLLYLNSACPDSNGVKPKRAVLKFYKPIVIWRWSQPTLNSSLINPPLAHIINWFTCSPPHSSLKQCFPAGEVNCQVRQSLPHPLRICSLNYNDFNFFSQRFGSQQPNELSCDTYIKKFMKHNKCYLLAVLGTVQREMFLLLFLRGRLFYVLRRSATCYCLQRLQLHPHWKESVVLWQPHTTESQWHSVNSSDDIRKKC